MKSEDEISFKLKETIHKYNAILDFFREENHPEITETKPEYISGFLMYKGAIIALEWLLNKEDSQKTKSIESVYRDMFNLAFEDEFYSVDEKLKKLLDRLKNEENWVTKCNLIVYKNDRFIKNWNKKTVV